MRQPVIYLRPISRSDITERYLSWFRDPQVTRFLEVRALSFEEVELFMNQGRGLTRFMYAICVEGTDLHIGNIKIDVRWRHSIGTLSIVIGDRDFWKMGIGTSAIQQMTQIAFEQLGVRKLEAGLYAVNLGSLACFERAGWRLEAILRDHLLFEERAVDSVLMSKLNAGAWRSEPPVGL